jgi:hypothetical protein
VFGWWVQSGSLLGIYKFTWTFPDGKTHIEIYHILIEVKEETGRGKQTMHIFHMNTFNLKKLNMVEAKEQYCVEISNRLTALENLIAGGGY